MWNKNGLNTLAVEFAVQGWSQKWKGGLHNVGVDFASCGWRQITASEVVMMVVMFFRRWSHKGEGGIARVGGARRKLKCGAWEWKLEL